MSPSAVARRVDTTGNRYDLSRLSDGELLAGTRRLVGASNQLLADLLAHLAEVEARGIHRVKACSSLYTYCVYELRFSEDAAFRRASAARFVKAFPSLFDAVARGELHLTGLLLLAPHLTQANQGEVLARAKHRTKKELGKLVRELDPLPDVPARIEPLGPAAPPRSALRNPTWAEYVASMVPVRHLNPGERPADWIDEASIAAASARSENDAASSASVVEEPNDNALMIAEAAIDKVAWAVQRRPIEGVNGLETPFGCATHTAAATGDAATGDVATGNKTVAKVAPSFEALPPQPVIGPQRFRVQFTATQEYVDLVERAKALLSHTSESASLDHLHWRAMQALVAELEKKKYGSPRRQLPIAADRDALVRSEPPAADRDALVRSEPPAADREPLRGPVLPQALAPGVAEPQTRTDTSAVEGSETRGTARPRHIPARIRRRVFERDAARCTFEDESGQRCREVERLELHHLKPFARDGQHHADNLTLRCQSHNALAAEQDFGREFIHELKHRARHESQRSNDEHSPSARNNRRARFERGIEP